MLRKYLSRSRRLSSVTGTSAETAAAQIGEAEKCPYWQKLLSVCQLLDQPVGLRSPEGMRNACVVLRDIHFFGCASGQYAACMIALLQQVHAVDFSFRTLIVWHVRIQQSRSERMIADEDSDQQCDLWNHPDSITQCLFRTCTLFTVY